MPQKPNILWIVADALRPDRCGCYGYDKPTTPTIDRLAEAGLRAETAISQGGYSLPSYTTMLTGLYPTEHGLFHYPGRLSSDLTSIAETMSAAGYVTATVGGNPFFSDFFGLTRGFDLAEICERINIAPPVDADGALANISLNEWPAFITSCGLSSLGLRDKGGARINKITTNFIDAASGPWFCFLHYMETHSPYWPPLRHRIANHETWIDNIISYFYTRHIFDDGLTAAAGATAERLRSSQYDGEVAYTDSLIRKLLARLEKHDNLSNTIVIVCADHGELLGEGGLYRHATGFGETLVRVPLVIYAPDYIEPRVIRDGIVELRDVTHTLNNLIGAKPISGTSREAINLLVDEDVDRDRVGFSEWKKQRNPARSHNIDYENLAQAADRSARLLRHQDWEYIEYEAGGHSLRPVRDGSVMAQDQAEAEPEVLKRFRMQMSEITADLTPSANGKVDAHLPPEVADRLRQLGYL